MKSSTAKVTGKVCVGEPREIVEVDHTSVPVARVLRMTPAAFDPTRPPAGTKSTGPGDNNDRESMTPKELKLLAKHEKKSIAHLEEARQNFFANTVSVDWTGIKGEQYHIRALNKKGQNSEMEHKWPMAFVGGEPQTINAAMWLKHDTEGYILVSIWTFSSTGDETNQYYKQKYREEAYEDGYEELIPNKDALRHFSVSSGDYYANFFYCPPLEPLTEEEMTSLKEIAPAAPRANSKGKKRKL